VPGLARGCPGKRSAAPRWKPLVSSPECAADRSGERMWQCDDSCALSILNKDLMRRIMIAYVQFPAAADK
jgi:hypothetical protein